MIKETQSQFNDEIECPHCGAAVTCLSDYELGDGGSTNVECDCGKTFKLTCEVTVTYTATADVSGGDA